MALPTPRRTVAANDRQTLRIALPSDRMMEDDTLRFMANCGLAVARPSPRVYTGRLASLGSATVLFQRSVDIPGELDEGAFDLAIVGMERYLENRDESGDTTVVIADLGYSKADLVVAVPNAWNDVRTMADLRRVAAEMRRDGQPMRVATKYHRQVARFLDGHQVPDYRLVHINGAIEAAPLIGTADLISDLSSSGATLRENNLTPLRDGTIVRSAACLVANKRLLRQESAKLEAAKTVLELMEARLRAEGFYSIIANIRGDSEESVARLVAENPDVAGMQGPTVARVISKSGDGDWYSVSVVVPIDRLTPGVDHLRRIGASGVVVFPAHYVFDSQCHAYQRLLRELEAG
ncbi:MAG: ATP phosphoribosyltransferase [Dehalococcoidia bacterium]